MIDACPQCGETDLSWADRRFGHCQRSAQVPVVRSSRSKSPLGYRDDLARFAGDPTAHVTSRSGLKKLIQSREDELGWKVVCKAGELDINEGSAALKDTRSLGREAVREALEIHRSA